MPTTLPIARRDIDRGPLWDTIVPIRNNVDFVIVTGFAFTGLSLALAAVAALPSFAEPLVQISSLF